MVYYSTGGKAPDADFREAVIRGQAPDGGLYFPREIPRVTLETGWQQWPREELAFRVMAPYVGKWIPEPELRRIVAETIGFPIPLVKLEAGLWALELFHGPTLAFKDVGARFMSRCLGYFSRGQGKEVHVLVATSGDTGGAVADGFAGVEGVQVTILFPSGKVSPVQEKQLTAERPRIRAVEIDGTFDDCQRLVKQAFSDAELRRALFLTSANSINVARWLPQQLYYFFALQHWPDLSRPPVFVVPSGNFGNICAGLMARASGLPAAHFIAACNINDTVPDFLQSGVYEARPARATISNAMDVGDPSNFVRMMELFNRRQEDLHQVLSAYSISDEETGAVLGELYQRTGYLADPHGAVGFAAAARWEKAYPDSPKIVLETAHPVKFGDTVEALTGAEVPQPAAIKGLMRAPAKSIPLTPDYEALRSLLMQEPG